MKAQAQGRDTGHSRISSGGGGVGVRDRQRDGKFQLHQASFFFLSLLFFNNNY